MTLTTAGFRDAAPSEQIERCCARVLHIIQSSNFVGDHHTSSALQQQLDFKLALSESHAPSFTGCRVDCCACGD